jgi:hypothetical protein
LPCIKLNPSKGYHGQSTPSYFAAALVMKKKFDDIDTNDKLDKTLLFLKIKVLLNLFVVSMLSNFFFFTIAAAKYDGVLVHGNFVRLI